MGEIVKLNKNSVSIIIMFIFLVSCSFLASSSEDFAFASQNKAISLCQCTGFIDKLIVQNNGYLGHNYAVSFQGAGAEFVTPSQSTFYIEPGKTIEIFDSIVAPCDKKGSFLLAVIITDDSGMAKKLSQTIDIQRCINIQVTPVNPEQTSSPCSTLAYEFKLKNTGSFIEEYSVGLKPETRELKSYFSANKKSFVLAPGAEESLFIYFNAPCSYFGASTNTLSVTTKSTALKATTLLMVNVLPKTNFGAALSTSYSFCEQQDYVEPVTIINDDDYQKTFELSIAGPDFLGLPAKAITLAANTSYALNLTASPHDGEKGTYPFRLAVQQQGTPFKKEFNSTAVVDECFDINVTLPDNVKACNMVETKLPVKIFNAGDQDAAFDLVLEGDNTTVLDKSSVSVPKGSEAVFYLFAQPHDAVSTKNTLLIISSSNKDLKVKKNIVISTISGEACYQVAPVNKNLLIAENTTELTLVLKNTGVLETEYDLAIDDPDQIFSLAADKVTIKPGEEQNVSIGFSIPENSTQNSFAALFLANANNQTYASKLTITRQAKLFDFADLSGLMSFISANITAIILILVVILLIIIVLVYLSKQPKKQGKGRIKELKTKAKKEIKLDKAEKAESQGMAASLLSELDMQFDDKHLDTGYKLDLEKKSPYDFKKYSWLVTIIIILLILAALFYFAQPYYPMIADKAGALYNYIASLKDNLPKMPEVNATSSVVSASKDSLLSNVSIQKPLPLKPAATSSTASAQSNLSSRSSPFADSFSGIKDSLLSAKTAVVDFIAGSPVYLYYLYYIVGGIVVLAILIFIINKFTNKSSKKNIKQKNNKNNKNNKLSSKKASKPFKASKAIKAPKTIRFNPSPNFWKTALWILVVIIILALIFYFMDYIREYAYYIVIGLIILAVLIVVDKKRNSKSVSKITKKNHKR